MGAPVDLREATEADVGAIRRVARESWHAGYDAVLGADTVESVVEDRYDPEGLREDLDRPEVGFWVADGRVVGFASAGPHPDEADAGSLYRLYVEPGWWGLGRWSRLLARAANSFEPGTRLELAVLAANDRACGFYERRGDERVETRETTVGDVAVTDRVYRRTV
jgi:GNAT superfamily N-acetyltransferase